MAGWTDDELATIDRTDELQVQWRRRDGSLSEPVTIWVARHGDDLYVRPVRGRDARWFRGTQERREGHVEAGGVSKDVAFSDEPELVEEIDAAFRTKYRRYAKNIVDSVLTPRARSATLKLVPK